MCVLVINYETSGTAPLLGSASIMTHNLRSIFFMWHFRVTHQNQFYLDITSLNQC